jgi:hypothetical protein
MLEEKKLGQALRQLKGTSKQGPFSRCVGYQHLATLVKSGGRQRRPQPLWACVVSGLAGGLRRMVKILVVPAAPRMNLTSSAGS